jgi:hypothetical protein
MASAAHAAWAAAGSSEGELRAWLHAHGVQTAAWGTGAAKSVAALLGEVTDGESVLLLQPDGAPLRQLRMCVRSGSGTRARLRSGSGTQPA